MVWLIIFSLVFVPICCCLVVCVLGRCGGAGGGGGGATKGWGEFFNRIFCGLCGCAGDAANGVVDEAERAAKDVGTPDDAERAEPRRRSGDRGGNACQDGCMWAVTCGYCCNALPRTSRWQERVARPLERPPGQVAQPAAAAAEAPAAGGGGYRFDVDEEEAPASLPLLPLRARVVVATPVAASYAAYRL